MKPAALLLALPLLGLGLRTTATAPSFEDLEDRTGFAISGTKPDATVLDRPAGRASPEDCGSCHKEQAEEWKTSLHAQAWTDPIYQASLKPRKRPKSCYSCHVPQGVLARAPKNPRARKDNFHHGIGCVECHVHEDKVHGPFGAKTDAHPSVKGPRFVTLADEGGKGAKGVNDNGLCLACHTSNVGPVLGVGKSFLRSKAHKAGKTCQSCHMPAVERPIAIDPETGKPSGPKRHGRRHVLFGPSDKAFTKKAFAFEVAESDGKVLLRLRNRAGHRIPALKMRRFTVRFSALDEEGKELWHAEKEILGGRKGFLPVDGSLDQEAPSPEGRKRWRVQVRAHFAGSEGEEDRGQVFEGLQ